VEAWGYPTIGKFFYQAEVFDEGGQVKCIATTSDYDVLARIKTPGIYEA